MNQLWSLNFDTFIDLIKEQSTKCPKTTNGAGQIFFNVLSPILHRREHVPAYRRSLAMYPPPYPYLPSVDAPPITPIPKTPSISVPPPSFAYLYPPSYLYEYPYGAPSSGPYSAPPPYGARPPFPPPHGAPPIYGVHAPFFLPQAP